MVAGVLWFIHQGFYHASPHIKIDAMKYSTSSANMEPLDSLFYFDFFIVPAECNDQIIFEYFPRKLRVHGLGSSHTGLYWRNAG